MSDERPVEPEARIASGAEAYRACLVEMVGQARRQLTIFSQTLDRRIYGDERFITPLQAFLLSHDHARLRVLIRSTDSARSGNRLVELGRRLSSRIKLRELPIEHRLIEREYAIADERSFLLRESLQELDARYYPNAPLLARTQLREFETLRQESTPAAEFRDLKI